MRKLIFAFVFILISLVSFSQVPLPDSATYEGTGVEYYDDMANLNEVPDIQAISWKIVIKGKVILVRDLTNDRYIALKVVEGRSFVEEDDISITYYNVVNINTGHKSQFGLLFEGKTMTILVMKGGADMYFFPLLKTKEL